MITKGASNPVAVTIMDLVETARRSEIIADFARPISGLSTLDSKYTPYSAPRGMAGQCLRWVWTQWLQSAPAANISNRVSLTLKRGMEFEKVIKNEDMRGLHDLFLLNCALFAGSAGQIKEIASYVCEATGDERNNGELHYRAWCGALKYEALGNKDKAMEQYRHLEGSFCPDYGRTANRQFLLKVIKEKWDDFVRLQNKDFERLWHRAFRNGIVRRESTDASNPIVRIGDIPIEQLWCWSHVGLALLAHRRGVSVATDSLWFPPYALKCVPKVP
jgi:hypothetical protein